MHAKRSFRAIVLRNEYKAIKGKYNSTIVYLFVVLFMTFLAFGFAKSTLNYQQKLSSDPFSNWVNLNFHSGTRDSLRTLHDKICCKNFRDRFHIMGSYFYNTGMIPVITASHDNPVVQYEARTIDPSSGIVKDLLQTGVCAKYFPDSVENAFNYEPNGVIISEKLLGDIGLDKQTLSFIRIKSSMGDILPVPVLAVVKELPDLADLVYTNLFYCKSMNTGLYDRDSPYYRLFIENMDTAEILNTLQELYPALEINDPSTVETTLLKTGNSSVMTWKIEIGTQENNIPAGVMNQRIDKMVSLKNHHYGQYYELSEDTTCDNTSFFHDYLAIEFVDLEKIRDFSKFLNETFALQLNLEVLSERENYLYTGNIAAGSIILLMLLSIISVSIYLSGIIRNHLLRVKKNLGDFLAFGVKNGTLIWLYTWVTILILAAALLPAIILAYACGEIFEKHLLGKILVVDPTQDYFSLTNSWFALFLVIILFVAIIRTYISVKKILKNTPGDLVYERD